MVKRALVERRPWLFASLLVALAWLFLSGDPAIPGIYKFVWKGVPVALLAVYAFQRHLGRDGMLLTAVLVLAAIADMFSELQFAAAGTVMSFSLLAAIWLYWSNRRENIVGSQKALALVLAIAVPVVSWLLLAGEEGRALATGFSLLMAIMAALAWTSRFSRYRVGVGAVLFVVSELLLFATQGPILRDNSIAAWLVWPVYYAGQLMIATGVVSRLRRERA
ncbi:lysoplasmalogenase family protein [Croceicoccus naphthovorans]|uniref:Uncharacterized protein n=1 Tax=Croceicoccus naphthovorans TaxID=1348774 RepID=A0A0G3XHX0_9SPHN|nr:lysoplasmalogenase family protein [Croceicoccus naphthovorans]AKM09993.1 hypothetical protein AB433_08410 [Croceicoccus naphthovorans]MBB3991133.1 signal transduction histidine kinase [Croceicoccus naphthovorans]